MRVALLLTLAGLSAPAAHTSATATSPCTLVRAADAKAVLGAAVGKPKLKTLGLFRSCSYMAANGKTVTVQTRSVGKGEFVKSAKANPGGAKAVAGLGATAYSAGGGFVLLLWKHGAEVSLSVLGPPNALAAEKQLAKKVLARL